jgi:hypothetical protein
MCSSPRSLEEKSLSFTVRKNSRNLGIEIDKYSMRKVVGQIDLAKVFGAEINDVLIYRSLNCKCKS